MIKQYVGNGDLIFQEKAYPEKAKSAPDSWEENPESGKDALETGVPTPEEMEQIGEYTRRKFGPEELYAFTVVLCDNETDRDLERFSIPALQKLAELFRGKTGIFNHTPDARNQAARIFNCRVETVSGRKTEAGEPYTRLVARAYLPRGGENDRLILALESGIQKEVSVGCAVKKQVCSICGADRKTTSCSHRKGYVYDGRLCVDILEEPTDAYEWSFVAVPAQREAGVIKRFSWEERRKGDLNMVWKEGAAHTELAKELRKAQDGLRFSGEECEKLAAYLENLEKDASAGRAYQTQLRENIRRLGGLVFPNLEEGALCRMTEGLSLEDLKAVEKAFMGTAEKSYPLRPQLAPEKWDKTMEKEKAGRENQNPYAI